MSDLILTNNSNLPIVISAFNKVSTDHHVQKCTINGILYQNSFSSSADPINNCNKLYIHGYTGDVATDVPGMIFYRNEWQSLKNASLGDKGSLITLYGKKSFSLCFTKRL